MQRIPLLLLMFVTATASAQVYKRIGPDGKVYFSDQPGPDAEQIDVAPAQAVSVPPVPQQTGDAKQQDDVSAAYSEFTVISPSSEQGVRANDGNVTVRLSLQPALRPGHTVALKVDGEDGEAIKSGRSLTFQLGNLSRGRHTVEATVLDPAGKALIQTGPVSFYVLRVAGGG